MISRSVLQVMLSEARMSADAQEPILEIWDALDASTRRLTELSAAAMSADSLRIKLRKAHAELERRRRRDVEMAHHLPAIAARLQSMAADAKQATAPDPAPNANWENDPEIDWTGIVR